MERAGAIRIVNTEVEAPDAATRLAQAVDGLLKDPESTRSMAANAREVVRKNRGAIERTLGSLMEILQRAQHSPA